MERAGKKAIVLVSFGTLRQNSAGNGIDAMLGRIKREFPACAVRNVFTSVYILEKLQGGGGVFSLPEALDSLVLEGCRDVFVLPTLLTAGEEYRHKVAAVACRYADKFKRLEVGLPLFESGCDLAAVLQAVRRQGGDIRDGEEIVLMGHGAKGRHNDVYERLQAVADQIYTDVSIGVLEEGDYPNFAHVWQRLKDKRRSRVYLMPLLFTAGRHVKKDMLEGESSWFHKLRERGVDVRARPQGLGESEEFQALYIKNLAKALEKF